MQDIKKGDRVAVRMAFNRIQRFRVKKITDVKAGTLYVTVRGTPMLNCCLVEAKWFDSKPKKDGRLKTPKWIGARFAFSMKDNGTLERYDDETDPMYYMYRDYTHVRDECVLTWLQCHNTFSYNTRVMQVITALRGLPHWEQYAIVTARPFNEKTIAHFNSLNKRELFDFDFDPIIEDPISLH